MDKILKFIAGISIVRFIIDLIIASLLCWFLIEYVNNLVIAIIIVTLLLMAFRKK